MEVLLGLVMLALVIAFVIVPFWRSTDEAEEDPVIADLEARKEFKYREIRDLELDHASGKISAEEFESQRTSLRAEAMEILEQLETARNA